MKQIAVPAIFFCFMTAAFAEDATANLNLASDSLTFCMSGKCESLPDTSLFNDAINNSIGKACMHNVRVSQLTHIADLNRRLSDLRKGNAIVLRNGRCSLTFPVIVGRRRTRVRTIAQAAVVTLRPKVKSMVQRLYASVPQRPELVFHLFWSRVIDDVWEKAWKAAFGQSPLPDATWSIFPQHPFTVGTYSYPLPGNGWLALTLNSNSWKYKNVVVDLAPALNRLAWARNISLKDESQLQQLGLLDSDKKFRVFTYQAGDRFDQLLQQMISEYATVLAGSYDYQALARALEVSPQHTFCMLLHETAYVLLDDLRRSGDLKVPVLASPDENRVVELVSIKTADPE
jgi:hypothetical protein